jgi:hypothetical protein
MGDDVIMTPDEATSFYEEDEDPQKIFAKFDAAPKIVTTRPTYANRVPASSASIYVQAIGLYTELRRKTSPKVSARGPKPYTLVSS